MMNPAKIPDSPSPIDIREDALVARLLPTALWPHASLMRLDRPIGTWLLLLPGWWSLAMAADTWWDLRLFVLFGVGAIVMRGAGCTWNDITDRDFDAKVARTATRPLPSGAITLRAALVFLFLQLLVGLAILLSFNAFAIAVGASSLALVFVYPLMKRVTYWPQFVLGLTFNWGALLGWAAVEGGLGWTPFLLYAAGIFWTLGYDTIYAHQDKEDDALIGVKSSALALGAGTRPWLYFFYAAAIALMAAAGATLGAGWAYYVGLAAAGGHLAWQAATVDIDDALDCLAKFRSNRVFGWILLAAIALDRLNVG
jgi:4-hydroxybenzoate polyprenyltransferase